ncbi:MAG: hypothetical protein H6739_21655 [Alphaproteobacteria bacterium]|nr:hypothetical protein [Alphaproteobacteria bacterium]
MLPIILLAASCACPSILIVNEFLTTPQDGNVVPPGFVIRGTSPTLFNADGVELTLEPLGANEWATPDDLPLGEYTVSLDFLSTFITVEVADVEPLADFPTPTLLEIDSARSGSRVCGQEIDRYYAATVDMGSIDQDNWAVGLVDEDLDLGSWHVDLGPTEMTVRAPKGSDICPTLVVSDPQGVWVHTEALPCEGPPGCATGGRGPGWLGLLLLALLGRQRRSARTSA